MRRRPRRSPLTAPDSERIDKRGSPDLAGELLATARDGVDLIAYFGHGSVSGWSSSPMVADAVSAARYDNSRPFLLLSFTCFDGSFADPWGQSLAWSFVGNPYGGALLATASSTLADPGALDQLAHELLCRLRSGEAATVGAALLDAKQALAAGPQSLTDLLMTYSLLGDPTTPNPWRL